MIWNVSDNYSKSEGGLDIYLTVDIKLQVALENILDNSKKYYDSKEVLGLIMEPNSSSILAIASRPNFDLNNYIVSYTKKK